MYFSSFNFFSLALHASKSSRLFSSVFFSFWMIFIWPSRNERNGCRKQSDDFCTKSFSMAPSFFSMSPTLFNVLLYWKAGPSSWPASIKHWPSDSSVFGLLTLRSSFVRTKSSSLSSFFVFRRSLKKSN